jgi:hypothetical protein
MYAQVEKPKENKSRAIANSVALQKSCVKQCFGFVGNRPESILQKKPKFQISGSSLQPLQLKESKRLLEIADETHKLLESDRFKSLDPELGLYLSKLLGDIYSLKENDQDGKNMQEVLELRIETAIKKFPYDEDKQYKPSFLPEMKQDEFNQYQESSKKWMSKRKNLPVVKLSLGNYLYHGTSIDVAKIIATTNLQPANPIFRKIPRVGHRWDASRDGFLSMAQKLAGVTVPAKSVVLRMKVESADLEIWKWKKVGGADEVVTTVPIPHSRLEWSTDKKTWGSMDELK